MKSIQHEYGRACFGEQEMRIRGNRRAIRDRVLNPEKQMYDYPETGAVTVVMHPTQVPDVEKDEAITALLKLAKETFPNIAINDIETVRILGSTPYRSQDGIRFVADKSDVDHVHWIEQRSIDTDGAVEPYQAEYF